jgi:enoyl-CoA hydratase
LPDLDINDTICAICLQARFPGLPVMTDFYGGSYTMEYAVQNGVAVLTMDDGKANAVGHTLIDDINAALDRAETDGAQAVLLCGREGMFSAGFDLKEFAKGIEAGLAMVLKGLKLAIRLYSLPLPLVAACTGHGIAMGAFLLLCCDSRVGARGDYKITLPETRISMDIPTILMTLTLSRLNPSYITRAAVQSEIFTPDEAVAAGFLDEVVQSDPVLERALAIAVELGQMPQKNYAANKLFARDIPLASMRSELEKMSTG